MKIEGEYVFDGPREEVWKMLRDPDVLVTVLPGTKNLKQTSANEYEGELQIQVGPIMGSFGGRLTISNEQPPESLTLTVEGTGKIGFAKGAGDVTLLSRGDVTTWMGYTGDIQIGGRVASVGQRLLDVVSKKMIGQGLDKLNATLRERVAKQSGSD
ncbi:MAG TPA: carbon monoxide dehydrogenase subunit G [Anaerolineales bacterium]